jgi:TetR/AcrR family transcriptional regulator, lmrAB and yxaGH operons repressor
VTRRVFRDLIATLSARLEEKSVPHERAEALAINSITAMEGAFDTAIAALSACVRTATAVAH